ncbi:uncharacterized protein L201_001527 [Kwoniella dendrophila CBS 6074]|uniref:BTB domain-containing protein n=1 Tax=Kwoniella dendrophila CBS 6074 TaxID=1295534 RepID=A0AAX4JMK3_9TREE
MSQEQDNSVKKASAYDSADADMTLVSSDGVEFKVHSYILKAHNSVFRDIIGDPNMNAATPIPIDAKSSELELFLDYMVKYSPPLVETWTQAQQLFSLADKYGCEVVQDRLNYRLCHLVNQAPWTFFCFASEHKLLHLGRKALNCMGSNR